jgi:hypothetical protein
MAFCLYIARVGEKVSQFSQNEGNLKYYYSWKLGLPHFGLLKGVKTPQLDKKPSQTARSNLKFDHLVSNYPTLHCG